MRTIFLSKFGVGALAGLTAALFPKLLPMVAGSGGGDLEWFTDTFLLASLVFALLVGAVVAVLEGGLAAPGPSDLPDGPGHPRPAGGSPEHRHGGQRYGRADRVPAAGGGRARGGRPSGTFRELGR